MADTKITALTAITTVDPAADVLPIVDVSDTSMAASGTTKKITSNQILGAGGTATLASATITGDLTVDTNTLKVDSGTNNVSIGGLVNKVTGVSGSGTGLTIQASAGPTLGIWDTTDPSYFTNLAQVDANCYLYNNAAGALLFGVGNVEAMRLNSNGLGVGVSPSYKLDIFGTVRVGTANPIVRLETGTNTGFIDYNDTRLQLHAGPLPMYFVTGSTLRMTLDATGNLGIGVTPSAWGSPFKGFDISSGGGIGGSSTSIRLFSNAFYNGSNYIYKNSASAARYDVIDNTHAWYYAAGGTAGNAITFTQAMTLDSSGNLLVRCTTAGAEQLGVQVIGYTNGNYVRINHNSSAASGDSYLNFLYNATQIGSITQNGTTGVLYNITSDYRLKESVQPLVGGLARVNALKPSVYKWKSDGSSGEGFLAHELAEVVPFAVTGEKDAVNEDGSIKSQGIDMSRVVPILVAAIQELTARVQTLETR